MALSRLEQLKLKFKKEEEEKKSKGKSKENYYPFWLMDYDKQTQVRFLLDENINNPNLYYVEKKEHTLSINGEDKKFPCLSMYGEECPICSLAAKFYSAARKFPKDSDGQKENQKKGKYYYRDRRYLMQALIKSDPLPPSDTKEDQRLNNIKVFQIGNELFQIIDSQIKRIIIEDSEDPFDLNSGYDFFIQKTKKRADGREMASYASSNFSRKPSVRNLEGKTLFDLAKFLPEKPSLEVLENALNSHLNGISEEVEHDSSGTSENLEKKNDQPNLTDYQNQLKKTLSELRREESATDAPYENHTSVPYENGTSVDVPNETKMGDNSSSNKKSDDGEDDAEIEKFLLELKKKRNKK